MPRPLRPIADGLICHVVKRGNNLQSLFLVTIGFIAVAGKSGSRAL
jgi:hypothetical protein